MVALVAQTVVESGTEAAGIVLPALARMIADKCAARDTIGSRVEEVVVGHPLLVMLKTMPGVGIRTEARILTEVSGKYFASAGHLAYYAELAPVTWRSRTSIRGDQSSHKGNKIPKHALFFSAFASIKCKDQVSRTY